VFVVFLISGLCHVHTSARGGHLFKGELGLLFDQGGLEMLANVGRGHWTSMVSGAREYSTS
jgi:hypothetical protein